METDGGGWTVIQRRTGDPFVDFFRNWDEYKEGFGDLQYDHWLGNKYLHVMSLTGQCLGANDLRIELERQDNGQKLFAKYDHWSVNSEYHKYQLSIGGYSGNAGDSLRPHNDMFFTTYDRDNDRHPKMNCAYTNTKGGFWYNACTPANLNGRIIPRGDGNLGNIPEPMMFGFWLKSSEMKIRRKKDANLCFGSYHD